MKLNTTIANIYQTQQRLTGLFVSAGSMLAIILELSLIIVGFVIKASQSTSSYVLWALFGIVGLLVALLVTKLTLTNAAKLRASLDAEKDLRASYKERSKGKMLSSEVKEELDGDIKEISSGRAVIYVLIGAGVLASIICETFVMQLLFRSLQPDWLGESLSIFLSTLVSCTVVSGELHKKRDSDIIKASLTHDSFLELAAKANTYDAFNKKMLDTASTHVEEILDRNVLATYAKTLVFRSIEEATGTQNFAKQVEDIRNQQLQIARLNEDRKQRLLAEVRGQNDVDTEPVAPIRLQDFFDGHAASEEALEDMDAGHEMVTDMEESMDVPCSGNGHDVDKNMVIRVDTESVEHDQKMPIKILSRRKSMTVNEAAKFLALSDRQIRRLREQGILVADENNQISSSSVRAYMKKRSAKFGPEGA